MRGWLAVPLLSVAIVREARRNRLDPLLVVALIRMESSFDNYAKSSVGAMGLMQVMPATGKSVATSRGSKLGRANNLFDAELNIELGTAYLASLIARFRSVESALVAYNPDRVSRAGFWPTELRESGFSPAIPPTYCANFNG